MKPHTKKTPHINIKEWSYTPFKGLKDIFKNSASPVPQKESINIKTDQEIFSEAMADVKEIREFRKIPPKIPPEIKPLPVKKDDSIEILRQIVKGEGKIRLSDTGEYIEWVSPNIRKDIAQKLHEGNFSVQDHIDLHGMTLIEAEEAFSDFFREAVRNRLFCIKVIHGRGLRSPRRPVLKEALKKWLHGTFRKSVLAYSTAKDCDGGLGATYIILKAK
jgi:DNA-nicking Smr family endonuclease